MSTKVMFKSALAATAVIFSTVFLFFGCSSSSNNNDDNSSSSITVTEWPGTSSDSGSNDPSDNSSSSDSIVNCLIEAEGKCYTNAPLGGCTDIGGIPVETCDLPKSSSSTKTNVSGSSSSLVSSSSFIPVAVKESFTETVNGVSFDMVYIPGGTFTLGCEKSSGCPKDTDPVSGVKVSNYFIGKTEVKTALYNAVMGKTCTGMMCNTTGSNTSMTWYDAIEFACKLSQATGKNYHMTTEAEWEYAAKNHVSSLSDIGSGEEWAYNSWSSTHSGGTDPVGWGSGRHTQKTRRDAQLTSDNITGRLIRSIEGIGPALRLALSSDVAYPPNMVPSCDIHAPVMGPEPANSYRDPRWITGSEAMWRTPDSSIAIGSIEVRVWEDGTARWCSSFGANYGSTCTNGQWFTSNNIAFVFVPSSGAIRKYPYIFVNAVIGSLISGESYQNGAYVGRIEKEATASVDKPTVSGLKSGKELADAAGDDYKMIDMENIPVSAQKQDQRLLDGTSQGWFQDNRSAGGQHHYRKDVDLDEFRFTVNQGGNRTMLANGSWFTVNNTFLRVKHKDGYTADYLYAVTSDGTFYHNSFMGYERADFRMFKKVDNGSADFAATCGDICSGEIPKNQAASMYDRMDNGASTFVPAKCPTGGCK